LLAMLAGCADAGEPVANGEMRATVKRVIDGDTVELTNGERVRLIGVNTPESVKPNSPVEPYGKEASEFTKKHLAGQEVILRFDVELRDRYQRLLAYLYLPDGTFFNEKLVREGYAQVMTVPPNVAHADLFLEAEREARAAKRGLWGLEPNEDGKKNANAAAATSSVNKQEKGASPTASSAKKQDKPAASSEAPEGKLIKGNINSKGEKIYHVPGSPNYDRTVPEVWFATEEEAQAAGFRPPKR